jgi:hypothetical protein
MARVLWVLILLFPQQGGGIDIDKILEKADALFEEAKKAYEGARDAGSGQGFIEAGFKLEEARIKYIVLQELGSPEKQKVAGDRIRAVNQLAKLIHDGKVAVSGKAVGEPAAKPTEPPPAPDPARPDVRPAPDPDAPSALALKPAADVRVRMGIPDLAKQKEAEKVVRDIFKEQYAKKAPADRQALARLLLAQTKDAGNDPAALWVMLRDAQENAIQACDVPTAVASIETTALYFDVDAPLLKNTALVAAGKNGKSTEDFAALAKAMLALADEFVAADQYDAAEKLAAAALQIARRANDVALSLRATNRFRDVTEAKTLYQGMKKNLETLAKNPDDAPANAQMGQLLCFVKGNWDLGVRFLVKGSDAGLKALAEKELAMSLEAADQAALGDGWWELSEKEKSPLRKGQMQAHARTFYEAALPGLASLQRIKVEKRLESAEGPVTTAGAINLLKLVDLTKDVVSSSWKQKGDGVASDNGATARLEIPYEPPAEYDFKVTFIRNEGAADVFLTLTKGGRSFNWVVGILNNSHAGFGLYRGQWFPDNTYAGATTIPNILTNGRTYTTLVQVRKDGVKGYLDGKLIKELKDPYPDLVSHELQRMKSESILGVGSYLSATTFLKMELIEVTGKGKKTR